MAIRYQNPLKNVRRPEQIEQWIDTAKNSSLSYTERRMAISWLRGAVTILKHKGSRAAVAHIKQVIRDCSRDLNGGQEGQDAE